MAVERMQEMAREMGRPYAEVRAELLGQVPLARISEPEEIAALVAWLVSAEAVAFTGQAFDPNNGAWMG
jgi:NAD(P)-dependent dehydrogenase (short-subunit alcohol dehydrogenase family)